MIPLHFEKEEEETNKCNNSKGGCGQLPNKKRERKSVEKGNEFVPSKWNSMERENNQKKKTRAEYIRRRGDYMAIKEEKEEEE